MARRKTEEDLELRKAQRFHKAGKWALATTILYLLSRASCDAAQHMEYQKSLEVHGQQQELVERALQDQSLLEQQLGKQGPVELDSSRSLADFLREGVSPKDLGNYMDFDERHLRSGLKPREMDAESLLLSAKKLRFKIDPPKHDPQNPAAKGGIDKYLDEAKDTETGHRFELRNADGADTLVFNRDTSFIVPRGTLEYGSQSTTTRPDKALEIVRERRALIMMDTSGSMCSNHSNFQTQTFNGRPYNIYLPSALALAIADFYIHEQNTDVSGFTFSTDSHATPFTRNMGTLAAHFARLQCGATEIDYGLMAKIVRGSNSALDIYVIADADIFSDQDMAWNIDQMKKSLGDDNEMRRVFFIEWRAQEYGFNPSKDALIKKKGLGDAYYSKISGPDDVDKLVRSLNEKLKGKT